jgi:ADP-ribose pyrophosphatase YjhB (NUDIX family)
VKPQGDHDVEFIARGLWLHGSRALLCRNLDKGYLYLPGGHIEFGESAAAALEREFLEEAGARVAAGGLLLVTEGAFATKKRWHHELNLVFRVEPVASPTARRASGSDPDGQEPPRVTSREKGIGFEWVDLAAAVDLDIRPLSVKAWLAAGAGVDPTAARAEWVSEIPR